MYFRTTGDIKITSILDDRSGFYFISISSEPDNYLDRFFDFVNLCIKTDLPSRGIEEDKIYPIKIEKDGCYLAKKDFIFLDRIREEPLCSILFSIELKKAPDEMYKPCLVCHYISASSSGS